MQTKSRLILLTIALILIGSVQQIFGIEVDLQSKTDTAVIDTNVTVDLPMYVGTEQGIIITMLSFENIECTECQNHSISFYDYHTNTDNYTELCANRLNYGTYIEENNRNRNFTTTKEEHLCNGDDPKTVLINRKDF